MNANRQPPGPKGHPLIGSLPEFRRDLLGFLTRCARQYGDVVAFRVFHIRCCLVNHPTLIEQVLVREQDRMIKNWDVRQLKVALGDGLLTNEGSAWQRQRRLIQPAFHNDAIRSYAAIIVGATERMVASWQDGEVRDLQADLMAVTLEIVAEALFGVDLAPQTRVVATALGDVMEWFERIFAGGLPLPLWVPTPANRKMRRAIGRFDALVSDLIRERRARSVRGSDLLEALLAATDEAGSGMTDRQVRDEVITLLLAGHETTALALSWTLFLLGQHPEIEAKLTGEIETVVGGRVPAPDDLPRLGYVRQVVQEAMRLYPPAWGIGREARAPIELGDFIINRGTQIFLVQWVTHRDARFFPEPERFLPERWDPEVERRIPKYAYFPFGGGPRYCVGANFAMMEAVLLLTMIVQRFRFRLQAPQTLALQAAVTLRPRHGIHATVLRRHSLTPA